LFGRQSVYTHIPWGSASIFTAILALFYATVGLSLAILYVALGKEEDARAEAEEILKLVPNFSVEVWGQRNPNKDQAQIERDMAALRKAGLK